MEEHKSDEIFEFTNTLNNNNNKIINNERRSSKQNILTSRISLEKFEAIK